MESNMVFNWYRIEQDTRQHERDTLQWAAHERLIAKVEIAQQSPKTKLRRFEIVYRIRCMAYPMDVLVSLVRSISPTSFETNR